MQQYHKALEEKGIIQSISRKCNCLDNSLVENFFGKMKNEMFYGRSWAGVSLEQFTETLDQYIHWYNEKRIKLSLGGMSPVEYRRSLRLI